MLRIFSFFILKLSQCIICGKIIKNDFQKEKTKKRIVFYHFLALYTLKE